MRTFDVNYHVVCRDNGNLDVYIDNRLAWVDITVRGFIEMVSLYVEAEVDDN